MRAIGEGTLTVVVVDDERLAREGLAASVRSLAEQGAIPPCTVVAVCETAATATAALRDYAPDVLFVDIQMPRMTGLEMLEGLEPEVVPPAVIFVTAYDEHALRAFGVHALDYLVKPVPEARVAEALRRAATRVAEVRALRAALETPPSVPYAAADVPYLRHLIIPDRGVRTVVPAGDIEWIEGETYYVRVHAQGRARLLRERLRVLADALDPAQFFRAHRSAIVRLDLVREIKADAYSMTILLSTGARVPLSRERVKLLEDLLRRG